MAKADCPGDGSPDRRAHQPGRAHPGSAAGHGPLRGPDRDRPANRQPDRSARSTSRSAPPARSSPSWHESLAGGGGRPAGADAPRRWRRSWPASGRVNGFRLSQPPTFRAPSITVAAFGPRAVAAAAARRPDGAQHGHGRQRPHASRRAHPNTAVWLSRRDRPHRPGAGLVGEGVRRPTSPPPAMPTCSSRPGIGDLVEYARTRPGPKQVYARMPRRSDRPRRPGRQRDRRSAARIAAYAAAGV